MPSISLLCFDVVVGTAWLMDASRLPQVQRQHSASFRTIVLLQGPGSVQETFLRVPHRFP